MYNFESVLKLLVQLFFWAWIRAPIELPQHLRRKSLAIENCVEKDQMAPRPKHSLAFGQSPLQHQIAQMMCN
jgi:hypothetical protein